LIFTESPHFALFWFVGLLFLFLLAIVTQIGGTVIAENIFTKDTFPETTVLASAFLAFGAFHDILAIRAECRIAAITMAYP
jgi:hypothetical protein